MTMLEISNWVGFDSVMQDKGVKIFGGFAVATGISEIAFRFLQQHQQLPTRDNLKKFGIIVCITELASIGLYLCNENNLLPFRLNSNQALAGVVLVMYGFIASQYFITRVLCTSAPASFSPSTIHQLQTNPTCPPLLNQSSTVF